MGIVRKIQTLHPTPRGNWQGSPFFRMSKITFKWVLQNQVPIDDADNDSDHSDHFDD